MRVHKCNHRGERKYTYEGNLSIKDAHSIVIRALWTFSELAWAYSTFQPGDIFTETFYEDRWYNIFEIHGRQGELKGWYGNVTHPARITAEDVEWDDLALDVWMDADGAQYVLDEDEFAALESALSPIEIASARGGLSQLQDDLRKHWRIHANSLIAAGLTARRWSIGTAESCTGGLIGDVITNRPGSSAYFAGGVLSYSNEIKQRVLGVSDATLNTYGAVSEQCALEMARGVRAALGVDVGVSATGIAGPDGGSVAKPVGLIFVGVSTPEREAVTRNVWPHSRIGNKQATVDEALRLLIKELK
jgi:PncC family amidohydrolase